MDLKYLFKYIAIREKIVCFFIPLSNNPLYTNPRAIYVQRSWIASSFNCITFISVQGNLIIPIKGSIIKRIRATYLWYIKETEKNLGEIALIKKNGS